MFLEIEETVCFLASFLYGKIPRSRVDAFCEQLANLLVDSVYVGPRPLPHFDLIVNSQGHGDAIVHKAAAEAFLNVSVMLTLLPHDLLIRIRPGQVCAINTTSQTCRVIHPTESAETGHQDGKEREDQRSCADNKRRSVVPVYRSAGVGGGGGVQVVSSSGRGGGPLEGLRRPVFHIEFSLPSGLERDESAVPRPYFEVQHDEQIYTAQAFAATRFGSTKLKTYQVGSDSAAGSHPFTMPSVHAYLQLLVFLNAIACLPLLPDGSSASAAQSVEDELLSCSTLSSSDLSSTHTVSASVCTEDSMANSEDNDIYNLKHTHRKMRETFASGDTADSGACCTTGSTTSGASDIDCNSNN